MKTQEKLFVLVLLAAMCSCSPQRQLANRLNGEWFIEGYELRQANGVESRQGNVGSIIFNRNGQGSQVFTSAITQMDSDTTGDFNWDNSVRTVYITGEHSSHRKAWFIMESSRNYQHWRSTDSNGNVQIMHLRKKTEEKK